MPLNFCKLHQICLKLQQAHKFTLSLYLNLMSRNTSHTRRTSVKKDGILKSSKENIDTYYAIQNENQVLKLKNIELQQKIAIMKLQLVNLTSNLTREQQQCERLKKQIRNVDLTQDIRLQSEKRALQEKIQLTKGNSQIFIRKIGEARETAVLQQSKIPNLKNEKKVLDRTLWEARTQNQGAKVILQNLQAELEKQRNQNAQLVSRRKQYGPKQTEISNVIQQKLKKIKNREQLCSFVSKQQASELIYLLLEKLYHSKNKQTFLIVEKVSNQRKNAQKQLFLVSLIRKKYLLFIKNQAMQKFRGSFRPLNEIHAFERIIQNTIKRRVKNKMFRIWRSQANKREYIKIRYFQAQTTIEKFSQSYLGTLLFSAFNRIKYNGRNQVHRRAALSIEAIVKAAIKGAQNLFFSALTQMRDNYLKDLELEQSAKSHSMLLVLSIYFSSWAKITKERKISNRFIKFKCFRQLKKLLALKKKRDLSQMLSLTSEKLKQIDTSSFAFCHMKKQTTLGTIQALEDEKKTMINKNKQLSTTINHVKQSNRQVWHELGVARISKYLKKSMQKAFNIWRIHNAKIHKFKMAMNMLHSKIRNDVNLGFALIQRRRFEKLKVSIAEKIESCEFSYNYLVKENLHIKEVLDNKVVELQRSKFSNILRRLMRNEKQIKHKYFYKFLRSGYKFWKCKKIYQRVDYLIEHKIMQVFLFLLKQISKQKRRQQKIENKISIKQQAQDQRLENLALRILENEKNKNKKLKRILCNVFNRNGELTIYNAYNKIKKILTDAIQDKVQEARMNVENKIKKANEYTSETQANIQMLRQKLSRKEQNIKNRILLACRKIFVRNSSKKVLTYFDKWRYKLRNEKKIRQFAEIMERKTRIVIKNKFMMNLMRKNGEQEVNELKARLKNYNDELNGAYSSFDRYVEQAENKMKNMEEENQRHQAEGKILEKKTEHMDEVKVTTFLIYWQKVIVARAFREWKKQKIHFVALWREIFNNLQLYSKKEAFKTLSQEMKSQTIRNRVRRNLSHIYAKKFRQNTGLAFKIWRIINLNKRIKQCKKAYELQISNHELVTKKHESIIQAYDISVNERINDRKKRKIFDFLKKYTRLKIDNNKNKIKLETWLNRGYKIQFYRLFLQKIKGKIQKNKKADRLLDSQPQKKVKDLFYKLANIVSCKKCIKRLFIGKFVRCSLLNLYEQFLSKTSNYSKYMYVKKKNYKTFCIQKVIQTFDKKRKDILCKNIRRWRRNQYEMNMGEKLFRRLTRRAICNKYMGMFYTWKLEAEAKKVLKYHYEEGEVKKRKVEIQRIQKFLHEFKKEKGLLLENEEGNFVMSPRFQKKKQEEDKKDKNLRYKFISRLIMSINGYEAPIKAYNNLHIYMKLREKYKKTALFVLNHLRKPDLLLAFNTWKKAAAKFRDDFQNMERKELIKILNKQKDKMQMQYSHKVDMDEKIEIELNRYKVLSHQRDKKQKLCALILIRNANRVKQFAFRKWRDNNADLRQREGNELARKGQNRIQDLEQQLRQLQELEYELQENNLKLKETIKQAVQIADMVKRISEERDKLGQLISEKNLTCESLIEENQMLNSKLHLAQKQAIRLLIISGEQP